MASGKHFGFTKTDLMVLLGIIVIVLLFAITDMPAYWGRAPESANRASCAANLHGIMESLTLYAADNNGHFPAPMPPPVLGHYSNQPTPSTISAGAANAVLASYFNKPYPQAGEPTASLWMLVLNKQCPPKNFICKSDPSITDRYGAQQEKGGKYYDNFGVSDSGSSNTLSYSIAYPWTRQTDGMIDTGYWWKDRTDDTLPLIADMAPLSGIGGIDTTLPAYSTNPKAYNSPNHNGDGQNVAYGDTHVEWRNAPYAGRDNDNIWTVGTVATQIAITTPGITPIPPYVAPPTGTMPATTAPSPVDIIMVPVRNVTTGKL